MSFFVLAVYDQDAQAFGTIFTERSLGIAERNFGDAVKSDHKDNVFGRHPEKFSLWLVGVFEEGNGEFEQKFVKRKLCDAVTFVRKE